MVKGVFVRFGFDELESRKFIDKSRTKQQRTPHEVYYIRSHSLQSISRLLPREHIIYLHWRGAFGVARFDLSGNARASIREASDRTGSTLFICIDHEDKFRQQRESVGCVCERN